MKKDTEREIRAIVGGLLDVSAAIDMQFENPKTAILYAYRYLLNREPESLDIVAKNTKGWNELRKEFMLSEEYLCAMGEMGHVGQRQQDTTSYPNSILRCADTYTVNRRIAKLLSENVLINYEDELEKSYRKIIRKGAKVVDIGAHVGRHSKVFREIVGESGKLFAFEPLPKQFEILKTSFGGEENVLLINKALSDEAGHSTFYCVENYPEESGLKVRTYNNADAITNEIVVEVDVLDNYYKELEGIEYIKLDAEGAELSILRGGIRVISEYKPIISIEYGYPSYSAYGLTKNSLWELAESLDYYITDVFGNLMYDKETWDNCCDTVYWDYFLVPKDGFKEFCLRMHA